MSRVTLCALLFALPVAFAADEEEVTPTKQELAALDATNKERKEAGVEPLKMNLKLLKAARSHSANMAKQNKFEHTLDGVAYYERISAAGYKAKNSGENIACGYPKMTAKEAVAEWMDSPPHKKNLLNPDFTDVGIAVAEAKDHVVYWTQVFGMPK